MARVFNFNLHYACNNRCRNCISHNTTQQHSAAFSLEQATDMLLRFRPDSNDIIILSGGEPSIYPDICRLLCLIREYSDCQIVMYSNGEGCYTPEISKAIASCVDRITLSCYGTEQEHLWQAGNRYSFKWLKSAIVALHDARMEAESSLSLEIKYIVTRHSPCNVLTVLEDLASPEQVDSVVLSRLLGEEDGEEESLFQHISKNIEVLRDSSAWNMLPIKLVDIQPCLLANSFFEELLRDKPVRIKQEVLFFDGSHTKGNQLFFSNRASFFPACTQCHLAGVCGTTATCYGALQWSSGQKKWVYVNE